MIFLQLTPFKYQVKQLPFVVVVVVGLAVVGLMVTPVPLHGWIGLFGSPVGHLQLQSCAWNPSPGHVTRAQLASYSN